MSGFLTTKDYSTYFGPASPPLLPGTLLDVAVCKPPVPGPDGAVVQVRALFCGGRARGGGQQCRCVDWLQLGSAKSNLHTSNPDPFTAAQVTVGHDAVSGGVLRQWDGLNMATLLPGMMVNVRIRQVRGLKVCGV